MFSEKMTYAVLGIYINIVLGISAYKIIKDDFQSIIAHILIAELSSRIKFVEKRTKYFNNINYHTIGITIFGYIIYNYFNVNVKLLFLCILALHLIYVHVFHFSNTCNNSVRNLLLATMVSLSFAGVFQTSRYIFIAGVIFDFIIWHGFKYKILSVVPFIENMFGATNFYKLYGEHFPIRSRLMEFIPKDKSSDSENEYSDSENEYSDSDHEKKE